MNAENIARVCHNAILEYWRLTGFSGAGGLTPPKWDDLCEDSIKQDDFEALKKETIEAVEFYLERPEATPENYFDAFSWKGLLPFSTMSPDGQSWTRMFTAIVRALATIESPHGEKGNENHD